ncbi:MAG: porin family protein [Rhodospirillaceae bacterium]|nr:porin family protein [Rhodospirillaceae bacterium]
MTAVHEAAVTPDEDRRDALLDEAIAAFREMLVADPGLIRVRLELARAFYFKGEDSLARQHFEAVLAGGVPEPVAANIHAFLAEIRARRRWSFNAGFAIAPDTNIGAGSDERTIFIPVFGLPLPFERDEEELTSSGVGLVLWGGGEYQYPMSAGGRLRAGANVSRREHSGSRFDEATVAVHLGPRALIDARTEASVLLTARQNWAGTVKDHHALGGRIEAGHRVSRSVTVNGRVSLEDRHYRTRTELDGAAGDISLGGAWVIAPTVRLELSAGYGRDRPERERERHERYRVGAGVSVALPAGFTVSGGGDYRWTSFEPGWFPHVEDGGARKDETWSARASVYNRGFTLMGFSPELGVVHEVRNTNAQLYDYERTSGELRFVRQF